MLRLLVAYWKGNPGLCNELHLLHILLSKQKFCGTSGPLVEWINGSMIWIKDKNNQFTSFYCQESLDSFTKVSKIHSGLPCCLHMFFFVCLRFVWWFPPLFPFASGQITSRFKTLLHYWFYWNSYLFDHPGYHLDISSWLDINRIPSVKKWIKWKRLSTWFKKRTQHVALLQKTQTGQSRWNGSSPQQRSVIADGRIRWPPSAPSIATPTD